MDYTPFIVIVGLVLVALLWPAKWDPAIRIKERQIRNGTHPESSNAGRERDIERIKQSRCPDCGEKTLLEGPSGGMSMNIACNSCLSEFNVGFGFGTGPFMVDRSGKLTEQRAKVFGIQPDEYRRISNEG